MSSTPYELSTNNGRIITINHHDVGVWAGHFFHFNEKISLATGNTYTVHLKAADAFSFIHGIKVTSDNGPFDIVLTEAPNISDGSTEVPVHNTNRTSTISPLLTVYNDSTGVSGGTELIRHFVPAGKDTSYTTDETVHWLLKRSTDYIIQFVNNSGATVNLNYDIVYHEHDDVS